MRSGLFKRTSTWNWLIAAALIALVSLPVIREIRGSAGLVSERPGVVASIASESHYSANDGEMKSSGTYVLEDDAKNTYYAPLALGLNLNDGDKVTLSVSGDQLLSINGHVATQMNFWDCLWFGTGSALIAIGLNFLAREREGQRTAEEDDGGALIGFIMVMPAVLGGFLTWALSLFFEWLNVPFWPLLILAAGFGVGIYRFRRITRMAAAKPA